MRHFLTVPLALAASLAAFDATAATVVSFDPDSGRNTEIVAPTGSSYAEGRWVSNGFNVDWTYENNGDLSYRDVNSLDFYTLSAGAYGYTGSGLSMNFNRRSGKTFSLLSIGLSQTISLFSGSASFTPYDSSGSLNYNATTYDSFELKFDDFMLEGLKVTGEIVSQTFSSFMQATEWWSVQTSHQGDPGLPGDGVLTLDSLARELFSDLVSLRVTSAWANSFDYRTSIGVSNLDPLYKNLPERCYFPTGEACVVPGVGEFYFFEDYYGDVPAYTTFSSFTFGTDLEDTEIAAIPLGSSLLFLGSGLLVLGSSRRRRS